MIDTGDSVSTKTIGQAKIIFFLKAAALDGDNLLNLI